jgi:hypothetical protein
MAIAVRDDVSEREVWLDFSHIPLSDTDLWETIAHLDRLRSQEVRVVRMKNPKTQPRRLQDSAVLTCWADIDDHKATLVSVSDDLVVVTFHSLLLPTE